MQSVLLVSTCLLLHCVHAQPLEYFYTASTQTGEHSLGEGCLKRDWEGTDPEGLAGHPWVANIKCVHGTYKLDGVNYGGPIQIWVEIGSMQVNGKALDVIGSSIWVNVGSEVSLEVNEESSIWVVGAPLDVRNGEPPRYVNYG